jgi:hypothetical protein
MNTTNSSRAHKIHNALAACREQNHELPLSPGRTGYGRGPDVSLASQPSLTAPFSYLRQLIHVFKAAIGGRTHACASLHI